MKVITTNKSFDKARSESLVIPVFKDEKKVGKLPSRISKLVESAFEKGVFHANCGDVLSYWNINVLGVKNVFILGLGKKEFLGPLELRWAFAGLSKEIKKAQLTELFVIFKEEFNKLAFNETLSAKCIIEGLNLGLYHYDEFKTKKDKIVSALPQKLILQSKLSQKDVQKIAEEALVYSDATNYARKLASRPANKLTPKDLAGEALKLRDKNIKVTIMGLKEIKKMGMGGVLGVSQGSDEEPKIIRFEYNRDPKSAKKIAIIGKGLTFDSGGICLKQCAGMADMKMDMAGAAAVFGIMSAIKELKPKNLNLTAYIAACENMPSGKALKPGDVITMMSGKTVEIGNTDAEGRLTLADMLHLACIEGSNIVVDLATLTGSCVVALGEYIAGIMSNSEALVYELKKSSFKAGEVIWQMPLPYFYKKLLKSRTADINNVGGKMGGTLTAGLFLQEFVAKNVNWAHIDIAGPAMSSTGFFYNPKDGTGFGVRTMLEYLLANSPKGAPSGRLADSEKK